MSRAVTLAALCVVCMAACGAGDGNKREIPAGPSSDADTGRRVLYVSQGRGDRVVAYQLDEVGRLPADPFSSIVLDNPRRLLLDGDVLYVLLRDRVVSIIVGADGRLPGLVTSATDPIDEGNPLDLALDRQVLYVVFQDPEILNAYVLERRQVPPFPISVSGTGRSDYRTVVAADGVVYASSPGEGTIDTYFAFANGALSATPDSQLPDEDIQLPDDLAISDGVIYLADGFKERISTYQILPSGLLPAEPQSRTKRVESYVELEINDRGDRIYASGFNKGRIDTYRLDPITGQLIDEEPFGTTESDVASFPTALTIAAGVLYVAQSGRDRVDSYILRADGTPPDLPSNSAAVIDGSFPNDLAVGRFPPEL